MIFLEVQLIKGKILTIIPHWPKEWYVSFKIQPHGILNEWSSLFHFTILGNFGVHGYRCPAFFIFPHLTKMYVTSTAMGYADLTIDSLVLPQHDVTSFYIEQSMLSASLHIIKISINGTIVKEIENNDARVFQDVLVYGSDPWHLEPNVTVSDFQIGFL